ncbi:MAG: chemotaxis protein CheW [Pseudomonadales bacterium]|jgi:chemotaxis-related protein WspD|nr:chemotaxis protein CheW [Pseudomonadales bacterium]
MNELRLIDPECRNLVGVWGDHSCDQLKIYDHCHNCPVYEQAGRGFLSRKAPLNYLEEWNIDGVGPDEQEGAIRRSLLIFRISNEWFAVPTISVRELLLPLPCHPVPHRNHSAFKGLVNLRGELSLCVDLGQMLNIQPNPPSKGQAWPRMLAIEESAGIWIFPIDEVKGIHAIDEDCFQAPPPNVAMGPEKFSKYLFSFDDADIALLDMELVRHAFRQVVQ